MTTKAPAVTSNARVAKAPAASGVTAVAPEQAQDFRLAAHGLSARKPASALLKAAAACGIRNAPPWAAPLSFLARLEGLTMGHLDRAVEQERSLIQVWSLRMAPYFVPTEDLAIFTTSLLPREERTARQMMEWALPHLDEAGVSALESIHWIVAAARTLLDGRTIDKNALQDGIEEIVEQRHGVRLWPWCERCAVNHIHDSQLVMVSSAGVCCFGPREGNHPQFVRLDQWLEPVARAKSGSDAGSGATSRTSTRPSDGAASAADSNSTADPASDTGTASGRWPSDEAIDMARAELARRYLRCFGPSTARAFGEWAGLPPAEAKHGWKLIEDEIAEVSLDGRRAWALEADLRALHSPPKAKGARLLPPYDPYLLLRDRETLIPEKAHRNVAWRAAGTPGVALVDGQAVGTWRSQVKGKRLAVTVTPFASLGAAAWKQIESEAEAMAQLRDCATVEVQRAEP